MFRFFNDGRITIPAAIARVSCTGGLYDRLHYNITIPEFASYKYNKVVFPKYCTFYTVISKGAVTTL